MLQISDRFLRSTACSAAALASIAVFRKASGGRDSWRMNSMHERNEAVPLQ